MVKELTSFSECGKFFVHSKSDGKLNVWNTVTGNLKQVFAPSLHLSSPCTCLTWISIPEKFILNKQNRKRKLKRIQTDIIALGTKEGVIALFSLPNNAIISTLRDSNSSSVQGLTWSEQAGILSVDGSNVLHWDLENKSVISKWECKSSGVSCIAVSPSGDLCATASININIWDLSSKKCIRTFIGHSSELNYLKFINENYLLSCGVNERHIAAWDTQCDDDKPIGRLSLGDNLRGEVSFLLDNSSLHMIAPTSAGNLLYFNQQINGRVTKSIKPALRIEFVCNDVEGETSNLSKAMPVVCARLRTTSTLTAAYGYSPFFGFETFSISLEREKQIVSVNKILNYYNKLHTNNMGNENDETSHVEYSNKVSQLTGSKRKLSNSCNEVTMEERLGNLCIDRNDTVAIQSTTTQNSYNLSHLLIQGLDSKDQTILESVLMNRDPKIMQETVSRLPVHALAPLVQELKDMMQKKTVTTITATEWLKTVLREHSSQLIADSSIQCHLVAVQSYVEAKLCMLGSLGSLSGRLGHLLQQLDADNRGWRNFSTEEPLVLYQEQDSSDDLESIADGDYESEDKWAELSDQEETESSS